MKNKILKLAEHYFDYTCSIRRDLHKYPELSNHEYKTSEYVKNKLTELGISFADGFAKTGIVGKMEFKNPTKKIIALRADMDALPVTEENSCDYISQNKGYMHACGHDAHMASLLGSAAILNSLKDELEGTVLLLFQPAEEKVPGGAKSMIREGAISNPKPDIIIGQHVKPGLPIGKTGFKQGIYFASVDEIYLSVKGKGGHAAMPDQITDTILATSHIIVALQQIVSRISAPTTPTVLSFGKISAPGAPNVIPSKVDIEGTLRTTDEIWRKKAHQKIKEIAESIAHGMNAECDVFINEGYPCLINNKEITERAQMYATEILGNENVVNLQAEMISEDFSYFAQETPATFYRLGTTSSDENNYPLHSSKFNIDEGALFTSISTLSYITYRFLADS